MNEEHVEVQVEIPRGSRNKYEWDPGEKILRLDRVLHSSVHYPVDYGFIRHTMAEDGDPLDALVLVEEGSVPGCVQRVRPVGLLDMIDEHGQDYKILAIPLDDPRRNTLVKLSEVPSHMLREIETFFNTYKVLEEKPVEVRGWHDEVEAWRVIRECQRRHQEGQVQPTI